MRARSLAGKTSASLFVALLVTVLVMPLGQGCNSTCHVDTDCNSGDRCLFDPGSGCLAGGHCGEVEPCIAQQTPIILCSCRSNETLSLFCTPNGGVAEPTTSGYCAPDGGESGAIADAGGQ
jgi:hypothetical protein